MSFVLAGLTSFVGCCLVVYHIASCHQLCCLLSPYSSNHPETAIASVNMQQGTTFNIGHHWHYDLKKFSFTNQVIPNKKVCQTTLLLPIQLTLLKKLWQHSIAFGIYQHQRSELWNNNNVKCSSTVTVTCEFYACLLKEGAFWKLCWRDTQSMSTLNYCMLWLHRSHVIFPIPFTTNTTTYTFIGKMWMLLQMLTLTLSLLTLNISISAPVTSADYICT